MAREYRSLTEAFRVHMEQAGWPPDRLAVPNMRRRCGRLQSQAYNDLKQGRPVPVKAVSAWLAMVLEDQLELARYRTALLDFLRERGVRSLTEVPADSILNHICHPAVTSKSNSFIDFLLHGFAGFASLFYSDEYVDQFVMPLGSDGAPDLTAAVRSMYVCAGRARHPLGRLLPEEQAIAVAAETLCVSLADYEAKVRAWREFSPRTTILARLGEDCIGATIVLPVSERAFDDVLLGRRPSNELGVDDLTIPTDRLILEFCAEFPALGAERPQTTKALLACLALQIGALVRLDGRPWPATIKALSFAGTPTNRHRLLGARYKATGRFMAKTGAELLLREVNLERPDFGDFQDAGVMLFMGGVAARLEQERPRSPDRDA